MGYKFLDFVGKFFGMVIVDKIEEFVRFIKEN